MRRITALLVLGIVGALTLTPAAHAAPTRLLVDDDGRGVPGNCNANQAAFSRIQAAVDAAHPGDTIQVCAGTYDEQVVVKKPDLRIVGAGASRTTIRPSVGSINTVALATGLPSVAILLVDGVTGVDVRGLTVDGSVATLPSDCPPYFGVYYRKASGRVDSAHVTGVQRCVSVGIFAQSPEDGSGAAVVTIRDTVVDKYGVVGIICNEPGTNCTIRSSTITGSGRPNEVTSSGVQIAFGAGGRVTESVVRGNLCGQESCGPDPLTQGGAAGILTFQAAPGTVISGNDLANNDFGVWLIEGDACCRTSKNTLTDNRFFGIIIQDGSNQTSDNRISGGNVGIAAVALTANAVATSRDDVIRGTAVAPVQTYSCCGFTAEVIRR
jgi:parallel beta-helix repeat protein